MVETLRRFMSIKIRIAETKQEKQIADKIVVDFHSYVKSPRTVGR